MAKFSHIKSAMGEKRMRRRELLAASKDTTGEFVDLGLSVKWAEGNIVKNGTSYSIGAPTDYGCYFSWGNVVGHNKGEGYNFSEDVYNSTPGSKPKVDISPIGGYDAARVNLGGNWRLPTKAELKELYDNTDTEWVYNYNGTVVNGRKFMKKSDHSVYIFFPACGFYLGATFHDDGKNSFYWSSTCNYPYGAYGMRLDSPYPDASLDRRAGNSVRAVL